MEYFPSSCGRIFQTVPVWISNPPDSLLNQIPGTFVTERQNSGQGGGVIHMGDETAILVNNLTAPGGRFDPDDLRGRSRLMPLVSPNDLSSSRT